MSASVSFVASALFLIHPTHVESVAWVSERKDVLSGVFFWASLYYSMKRDRYSAPLAYSCLILGLLSKPSLVVLPVIVILIRSYISDRPFTIKSFFRATSRYKYWLLTSVIFSVITFYLQSTGSHEEYAKSSSLMMRLPSIALGYWFYLYRIVVPMNLSFSYAVPPFTWSLIAASSAALIGLFYLAWMMRYKIPDLFFAIAWFTICWLPISGIIYIGVDFTVDRYLYLSVGGFFIIFAKYMDSTSVRKYVALGVIAIFSLLSYQQVKVWANTESLFVNATKAQPRSYMGWTNLGAFYQTQSQVEKAIKCHKKSIQINPNAYISEYNLSRCYIYLKDYELAAEHLEKSFRIAPTYAPTLKLMKHLKVK